ncbi:hypothetical protein [Fibrobacter sp.]|nr:hypothetical protein [Fibrobacter sp.]MBR3070571.1 hypothetical protein [Fibrobacter sp.]
MNNELEQKKEYSTPKMEIVQLQQETALLGNSCICPDNTYCCGGAN